MTPMSKAGWVERGELYKKVGYIDRGQPISFFFAYFSYPPIHTYTHSTNQSIQTNTSHSSALTQPLIITTINSSTPSTSANMPASNPRTPEQEHAPLYRQPYVADSEDAAYSPPTTPDQKAVPSRTFFSAPFFCSLADDIGGHGIIPEIQPTFTPSDADIPDNYVSYTIQKQKYLPPVTWRNLFWNVQWISLLALTITPMLTIYGIATVPYNRKTAIWA